MAAYTANQVSINNGQKNVVISSNESPEGVRNGDFICVGTFTPMEINRTYIDSNGKHVIELVKVWGNSNQSNQPAIVIPTTVDFKETSKALQITNRLFNDNTKALQDWQTKTGTVTFVDAAGVSQSVKTLKQMELDNQALHPYPWAMRKVEFEANRAQNNEKFAASGFVHFGKHYDVSGTITPINSGLYVYTAGTTGQPNSVFMGSHGNRAAGQSKEKVAQINVGGVISELSHFSIANSELSARVLFPPAEDGTRTYDSSTGASVTHTTPAIAFASETATNKVVTDRVDMWGLEIFLREINDQDPFVYSRGLVQSTLSSIDGVATVTDNVRPITYFAWYDGDESSRGRGVNWQTASEAARIKLASDPKNNIYFDDETGKFYQWCVRGRSFAGAGNGDWELIDSVGTSYLKYAPASGVKLQGIHDYVSPYYTSANSTYSAIATGSPSTANIFKQAGAFSSFHNGPSANGECYFLVCGTVNRLNQGAYHPSLNPSGTRKWQRNDASGAEQWYGNNVGTIQSKRQAFHSTLITGESGARSNTGAIGQDSGRPDGRFYDAIYASGQGGVCRDMRYSAWGLTQEDFAEADLKVKSGEYRGREAPIRLKFLDATPIYYSGANQGSNVFFRVGSGGSGALVDFLAKGFSPSSSVMVYQPATGYLAYGSLITATGHLQLDSSQTHLRGNKPGSYSEGLTKSNACYIVAAEEVKASWGGEFTHMEVIGDPASILQCEDLKDGWVGSWNPKIPTQGSETFQLTRKCTTRTISRKFLSTPGDFDTWTQGDNHNIDQTANTTDTSIGDSNTFGGVAILEYTTSARTTESYANFPVRGGSLGIGAISCFGDTLYSNFVYSLTQETPTQRNWLTIQENIPLTSYSLYKEALSKSGQGIHHLDITTDYVAQEGGKYVKALNYNSVSSQQAFITYAYVELIHSGTDLGDNNRLKLVDNQSTMLDTNGKAVKTGTARIVEPLGWVKNDK